MFTLGVISGAWSFILEASGTMLGCLELNFEGFGEDFGSMLEAFPSLRLSLCLSLCVFVRLPFFLSGAFLYVCLSLFLAFCLYLFLSFFLSGCISLFMYCVLPLFLSLCCSFFLSILPSFFLYFCLSVCIYFLPYLFNSLFMSVFCDFVRSCVFLIYVCSYVFIY